MRFARTFFTLSSILAILVSAIFLPSSPATAEEFSSLEERMSHREFTAAGLDKLSPDELEALNAWVRLNMASVSRAASSAAVAQNQKERLGFDSGGPFGNRDAGGTITSRVKGKFRGWEKKGQRFELENGQVWEVTDAFPPLRGVALDNPLATIQTGLLGVWYFKVEGLNARVKVKRIK